MLPSAIDVRGAREAFQQGRLEGRAEGAKQIEQLNLELAVARDMMRTWRRRHGSLGRALTAAVCFLSAIILWLAVSR